MFADTVELATSGQKVHGASDVDRVAAALAAIGCPPYPGFAAILRAGRDEDDPFRYFSRPAATRALAVFDTALETLDAWLPLVCPLPADGSTVA